MLATIDSTQGHEYPFVILDLVTSGGLQYSLGFLIEARRMCVGLSLAKNQSRPSRLHMGR